MPNPRNKKNNHPESNQPIENQKVRKRGKNFHRRNWFYETIFLRKQKRRLLGWQKALENAWAEVHQLRGTIQQPLPGTSNTSQGGNLYTDEAALNIKTVENMDKCINLEEQNKTGMTDLDIQIAELNTEVEVSENMEVVREPPKDNTVPNTEDDLNTDPSQLDQFSQSCIPDTSETSQVINVNTDEAALNIKTVENMDKHIKLEEQNKTGMTNLEIQIADLNTQVEVSENMEVAIEQQKDNTIPNTEDDLNSNTGPSQLHDSEAVLEVAIEKNVLLAEETTDGTEPQSSGICDILSQSVTNSTSTEPIDFNDIAEKESAIAATKLHANIEEEYNAADNNSPAELADKHQSQEIGTDETTLPPQVITENSTALSTNAVSEENVPSSCETLLLNDQIKECFFVEQEELAVNSNSDKKSSDNSENKEDRSSSEHQTINIQAPPGTGKALDSNATLDTAFRANWGLRALLEFLGFEPDAGHKSHKELVKLKRNMLPPCQFPSYSSNCPIIYTSNWPTWMNPGAFRSILKVLTDFNYYEGVYYIDVLQYKTGQKMGAALIKFIKKEDFMLVYDQLRVVTLLNPKIKIELDSGNFIVTKIFGKKSQIKQSNFFMWLNQSTPPGKRLSTSLTSILPPKNYKEDPPPPEKPQVHLDKEHYLSLTAIYKVQEFLGLEQRNLLQNKAQVEQKAMNICVDIPENCDSLAKKCKAIYMSNFPVQFHVRHYKYVLRLLSNFSWDEGIYYIDVLQYSNHGNMGAILIKFASSEDCMNVFKELSRVVVLQERMPEQRRIRVQLDLHGYVAKARKTGEPHVNWTDPNLEPQFRARSVVTNLTSQKVCPDVDTIFKLLNERETNQGIQLEKNKKQTEQVRDDDDDVIILQTQSVPEIDLTEDGADEDIAVENKENSNKKLLSIDISDEDSNELTKQNNSVNNLSASISEELKDIDFNKMIEANDADSNSTRRIKNKENNNQNTMAKIAALYPNSKKSSAVKTLAPSSSRKSGNMDTTVSSDEMMECDSDTEDTCKIVYLKNLPRGKTHTILKEMIDQLTKFDMTKKMFFIKMLRENGTNMPVGECLLKFNTHADAVEVANSLNGVFVEKNIVKAELDIGHKVSKAYDFVSSNTQTLKRKFNSDGSSQGEPKRAKFDETWDVVSSRSMYRSESRSTDIYGINKEFLMKLGCKLPLTTYIIVKNLHLKVTEEKLVEVFSLAGNVKQVTLNHEYGKNWARIEYDHPVETVQAVSMFHHQKLYDMEMDVRNDNFVHSSPLPAGLSGIGKGLGKNGEPIRGVRTNIELQQVHEILYEMGRMNKYESKDQPLQAWYTKRTNPPPVIDTPSGVKIVKPGTKPNTAVALEALGAILVSLDIIPSGTNCSNLNNIIEALSKNPEFEQNFQKSSNNQKEASSTSKNAVKPQINNISKPIPNVKNVNKKGLLQNPNIIKIPTNNPPPRPLMSNLVANPLNNANNVPPVNRNNDPNNSRFNANMRGKDSNTQPMHGDPNTQPAMHGNPNMQPVIHENPNMQPVMHVNPNMQPVMHFNPNMKPVLHVNTNMQPFMHGNPNMMNPNMGPNVPANLNMPMNPNISNNATVWGTHHGPVHPMGPANPSPRPTSTHYGPVEPVHLSNPVPSTNTPTSSDRVIMARSTVSKLKEKAEAFAQDKISTETTATSNLVSFRNLPPSVTTAALTAKMKEVGELQFSEVVGNGRALVRFKELSAAERCIRLFHRSKVDGHTIDVQII